LPYQLSIIYFITMEIFGPIPSRRLGRSLGINNIPPKACSYYCTYCQVGPTSKTEVERRQFYGTDHLVKQVKARVIQLQAQGETIDHLSFVPDGEPTLDIDLGETIEQLRPLGIKIAVITNASLIWQSEVREALKKADWVSLKIDSVNKKVWKRINLPHRDLNLAMILSGMLTFAQEYQGTLVTETMLVQGVNVSETAILGITDFIRRLDPKTAYFLVPTRPPAIAGVRIPTQEELNLVYQILNSKLPNIEYLSNYEGNTFASSGNVREDLLSITAVHPMRQEAVQELLDKNRASWEVVEQLVKSGEITITQYEGNTFYLRRF
jgi:wyosine [tRNA(Phe)-imidazoG37] synthetase (radical SAM superfamily)